MGKMFRLEGELKEDYTPGIEKEYIMSNSEKPQRERQIVQELERSSGEHIEFALDGTVCSLENKDTTTNVKVPSRVEGRFRTDTIKVKELGVAATYVSLTELLYKDRQRYIRREAKEGWTIDDIPADVQTSYRVWLEQQNAELATGLQAAAKDILQTPVDRQAATQPCPNCHSSDHRYACRTSGWNRELYSYPLMRVQDLQTNEIYEVPFDAALYVSEHPLHQVVFANEKINAKGRLSAACYVGVQTNALSARYVTSATDGRVQPKSEVVSLAADGSHLQNIRIALAEWAEEGGDSMIRVSEKPQQTFTALQIIEKLQAMAVLEYAERVSDVDYNALLQSVRKALGAKGLTLAFNWRYAGMGDSDPYFQALNKDHVGLRSWTGLDAHGALVEAEKDMRCQLEG